jgi:acetyltransferase-like isoleucine patch superfamily enzyme
MNLRKLLSVRCITLLLRIYYSLFEKNLSIGNGVKFDKIPILKIKNKGRIIIGKNATINSNNRGYHLNMHNRVKLVADRPNAIISIGEFSRIHGSCIHAFKNIAIGKRCLIAANCQIFDGNGHDLSFPNVENRINTLGEAKEIVIEDNVWIGANCIVLPGITIGEGSVIAAGSVVNTNVPKMSIAGGNPIKIIRNYF